MHRLKTVATLLKAHGPLVGRRWGERMGAAIGRPGVSGVPPSSRGAAGACACAMLVQCLLSWRRADPAMVLIRGAVLLRQLSVPGCCPPACSCLGIVA